ncbi:MAG: hypothetical protein AB8B69_05345, partial [Chitinophagales bacterium]
PSIKENNRVIRWKGKEGNLWQLINDLTLLLLKDDKSLFSFCSKNSYNSNELTPTILSENQRRNRQNEIDLLIAFAYQISNKNFEIIVDHFEKKITPSIKKELLESYQKLLAENSVYAVIP